MSQNLTPGAVVGFVKSFFKRIALHVIAIVCGVVVSDMTPTYAFCAYMGIICLIPAGFTPRKNEYLVPAVLSAGQLAVTWLWGGVPLPLSLFWAGAQTWLLQALYRRFNLGWQWATIPLLILGLVMGHDFHRLPLALFLICTAAGYVSYQLITLHESKIRLNRWLFRVIQCLEPALKLSVYPEVFDAQFRRLEEQSKITLGLGIIQKRRLCAALAPKLEAIEPELKKAVKWQGDEFNSPQGNYLLASLDELNTLLGDSLNAEKERTGSLPGPDGAAKALPAAGEQDEFAQFLISARQLKAKKSKLPEALQKHVDDLALSTQSIIGCMREDPEDVMPGTRFLNRYLPAVHKLVDEYMRLSSDGAQHENIKETLTQSELLLERMVVAFHEEHGNLLRNDNMRFHADIKVLDKLLKMDGR